VYIPSSTKPGAQADDQGGIAEGRAGIPLGQDRIHQYVRRQDLADGALWVDDDRHFPFLPAALDFFFAGHPSPDQPFDLGSPCENGFAEGDSPAHSQRFGDFCYADPEARADQPLNNARGHFASAFDQDDEILQPLPGHFISRLSRTGKPGIGRPGTAGRGRRGPTGQHLRRRPDHRPEPWAEKYREP
jgi:hypothetical protein